MTLSTLGTASLLTLATTASAGELRTVVRLNGPNAGAIHETEFRVERAIDVEIEGVGAGDSAHSLYAFGWIARADDDRLIWTMTGNRSARTLPESRNLSFSEQVRLEPGPYRVLYFGGRSHQAPGPVSLRRLFGPRRTRPDEWSVTLQTSAHDADAVIIEAWRADPAHEIRLAPLGSHEFAHRRFRLLRDARVEVRGLGEAFPGKPLADRSWLVELITRKVVWAMDPSGSGHAGGAKKNREVRAQLDLPAGDYELFAITDDSHAPRDWNDLPPTAPESWGVILRVADGETLSTEVSGETVIARLAGAEDDESATATFRLPRPTFVRTYAIGEYDSGSGELADHGWIENSATGQVVWTMRFEDSTHAGGTAKNRATDLGLSLPAGTFRLRYVTDDSHAVGSWNSSPPADSSSWGITLSVFEANPEFELVGIEVVHNDGH